MEGGATHPSAAAGPEVEPQRARPAARRPAVHERPGAVAAYFGYRALASLLLATPLSVLAAQVAGGYPGGDVVLFAPGGLMLVEVQRLAAVAAAALAAQLGVGALLAAALGLIPLAALLVALAREGPLSAHEVGARVARALGPLALLWGVALAAEVAAAALVLMPGMSVCAQLAVAPRTRDLAAAGVAAAALVPVAAIGLIHDVARVAAVGEQRGFYDAVARALAALQGAPLAAAWAYSWRGALTLAAFSGAAWGIHAAGAASGPRVAAAFGAHLAALAVAAVLRASWLAAALRLLDRTAPSPMAEPPADAAPGRADTGA
ncbi:hypothetical protein SOCE26_027590 [Sorangium cellulosum]|uniref:Uncharacterized protein n=1 Tax=Sorangium cellulosum TaxID=56 RepID=A0A2L0EPX5_SORCE|nr:hypothetical protein SOCE26_027590 [Sorangium cellulosum]